MSIKNLLLNLTLFLFDSRFLSFIVAVRIHATVSSPILPPSFPPSFPPSLLPSSSWTHVGTQEGLLTGCPGLVAAPMQKDDDGDDDGGGGAAASAGGIDAAGRSHHQCHQHRHRHWVDDCQARGHLGGGYPYGPLEAGEGGRGRKGGRAGGREEDAP